MEEMPGAEEEHHQLPAKRSYSEFKAEHQESHQEAETPAFFGRGGGVERQRVVRQEREEVKDRQEKRKMEGALQDKYGKGLKMLKMMGGFEVGKGVGKRNQGIVNPVEAVVATKGQTVLGEGVFDKPESTNLIKQPD